MSPSSPVKKGKQSETEREKQAQAAAKASATATAADAGSDEEQEDEEDEDTPEKVKSKAEESNALEKLTDVVEEKQMDENKMKEAFLALRKQEEADKEAERKRCVSV